MNTNYSSLPYYVADKVIFAVLNLSVKIGEGLDMADKFINKNMDVNKLKERCKSIVANCILFGPSVIGGVVGAAGGKYIASCIGAKLLTTAFLMTGGAAAGAMIGTAFMLALLSKALFHPGNFNR